VPGTGRCASAWRRPLASATVVGSARRDRVVGTARRSAPAATGARVPGTVPAARQRPARGCQAPFRRPRQRPARGGTHPSRREVPGTAEGRSMRPSGARHLRMAVGCPAPADGRRVPGTCGWPSGARHLLMAGPEGNLSAFRTTRNVRPDGGQLSASRPDSCSSSSLLARLAVAHGVLRQRVWEDHRDSFRLGAWSR
jgi:hypothetical protein